MSLTPFINNNVHNALQQAVPSVSQALYQVGHVSNWHLIHTPHGRASCPIFDSEGQSYSEALRLEE